MRCELFANLDVLRETRRYVEGNGLLLLGVLGVGLLLLWLAAHLWDRYRQVRGIGNENPRGLFLELCGVHELSFEERELLTRAAASLPPEEAARMFVDPRMLHPFVAPNAPDAEAYSRLHATLFGEPD